MSTGQSPLKCLLCSDTRLKIAARLTPREIRALWHECGTDFPPKALGKVDEVTETILWQCSRCGFQFFDPTLAGDGSFYELLDSSEYYCSTRPEFQRTTQFAVKHKIETVLDVGCGSGDFLDQARHAGLRTFGLELSPSAAAKARAKGHRIFDKLLHQLPADTCPGGFDLITLFQVLEHVPDPVGTLKHASAHLKPGGYLSIAVPSRSGIYRLMQWDPTQWPPHHISRWRLHDLKTLAERTNLRLAKYGGDILLGSSIRQAMLVSQRTSAALGKQSPANTGKLPGLISWIYRKSGLKHLAPNWGPSIYAYFEKR